MSPFRAHLVLLLACALWGSGNVSQKTILEHMGPLMATGLTCLLGSISLLPFAWREKQGPVSKMRPNLLMLLATLLSFAAANTALQIGYGGTSVSNAGFLVNTSAAITPIAAWFTLRETPSFTLVPSILLVLTGVWLMGGASFTSLAWGDIVCLLAAVLYAITIPLVSRHVLLYGKPAQLTCMQFVVCGIICICLALAIESVDLGEILQAWPELLLVGIVSKGIAYFLMASAQQHTSAAATSVLTSAEAIFGALFAALLLGQHMSGLAMTGAALIMFSIVLLNLLPQGWDRRKVLSVLTGSVHDSKKAGHSMQEREANVR